MRLKHILKLLIAVAYLSVWIATANGQTDIMVDQADAIFRPAMFNADLPSFDTALQAVNSRVTFESAQSSLAQALLGPEGLFAQSLAGVAPRIGFESAQVSRSAPLLQPTGQFAAFLGDVQSHISTLSGQAIVRAPLSFPADLVNDQSPPQLVGSPIGITASGVVSLTWTINEYATSTLEFGLQSGSYTESPIEVTRFEKRVTVGLTNLAENTTYYGRLTLIDRSGNQGQSQEFTFGRDHVPDQPTEPNAPPLVLIYAVLDNNLGEDLNDVDRLFQNIEKGTHSGVTVRLLLDRLGTGNSYLYDVIGDPSSSCSISVDHTCGGRYTPMQWTEDSAHPASLADFVTQSIEQHQSASNLVLSLIGHGSGWGANALPGQPVRWDDQPGYDGAYQERIGGMLWDDTPGVGDGSSRSLSTKALGQSLAWINTSTGRGIDLLYLDACSMGMVEVAYELRGHVTYLLASPNTAWASFAYDVMLTSTAANMDARQIGEAWLAAEANVQTANAYPYTLSLVQVAQLPNLLDKSSTLADALAGVLSTRRSAILNAVERVDRFESNYDGTIEVDDTYVDLKSFAQALIAPFNNTPVANAAQAVSDVVDSAVITTTYRNGNPWLYPGVTWHWQAPGGIGIYLPLEQDESKRTLYTGQNLRWAQEGRWDEFLHAFWTNNLSAAGPHADLPTCIATTRDCTNADGISLIPDQLPFPPTVRHETFQVMLPFIQR